jgi:hypothetical protein
MTSVITTLFRYLVQALIILIEFLTIVFLGIFVAIIYALPWVLRIGAVIIWFYGGYRLVVVVGEIYTPFSPEIPVMILQFFVIIVQLSAMLGILIVNLRLSWGALYFTGSVPLWLATKGIPNAITNWQHADFMFRVLPPALWVMLLTLITIKGKRYKMGKQFRPSFVTGLPDFVDLVMDKTGEIMRSFSAPNIGENDIGTKPQAIKEE